MTGEAAAHVSDLIASFAFWRGYKRRNQFEDEIAVFIGDHPEVCFAVAMPELKSSVPARRAAATVILGRLVEVTQMRFAADVERDLMSALSVEHAIGVADELATALGRAWDALDKSVDLLEMARDRRPAYRLVAAQSLALLGESPAELATLRRLASDKVPRVRAWAKFGLAPPDS